METEREITASINEQLRVQKQLLRKAKEEGNTDRVKDLEEGVRLLEAYFDAQRRLQQMDVNDNETLLREVRDITIQSNRDIFKILDECKDILDETLKGYKLPAVIVVGEEKHGKSTILFRLIGVEILPRSRKLCTKVPIRIRLRYDGAIPENEPQASVEVIRVDNDTNMESIAFPRQELELSNAEETIRTLMEETVEGGERTIRDDRYISIEIAGSQFPNMVIFDMPGLVVNDTNKNLEAKTHALNRRYLNMLRGNSITLVVRALEGDRARNSQVLKLMHECGHIEDPVAIEFTLGVFTKADRLRSMEQIMAKVKQEDGVNAKTRLKNGYSVSTSKPLRNTVAAKLSQRARLALYAANEKKFFYEREIDSEDEDDEDREREFAEFREESSDLIGVPSLAMRIGKLYKKLLAERWLPVTIHRLETELMKQHNEYIALGLPAWHETRNPHRELRKDRLGLPEWRDRSGGLRLTKAELFAEHIKPVVERIALNACKTILEKDDVSEILRRLHTTIATTVKRHDIREGSFADIVRELMDPKSGVVESLTNVVDKGLVELDRNFQIYVASMLESDSPGNNDGGAHSKSPVRIARFPEFLAKIAALVKSSEVERLSSIRGEMKEHIRRAIDKCAPAFDFKSKIATVDWNNSEYLQSNLVMHAMSKVTKAFVDKMRAVVSRNVGAEDVDDVESCSGYRETIIERIRRVRVAHDRLEKLLQNITSDVGGYGVDLLKALRQVDFKRSRVIAKGPNRYEVRLYDKLSGLALSERAHEIMPLKVQGQATFVTNAVFECRAADDVLVTLGGVPISFETPRDRYDDFAGKLEGKVHVGVRGTTDLAAPPAPAEPVAYEEQRKKIAELDIPVRLPPAASVVVGAAMNVKELKALIEERGMTWKDCVTKEDLLKRAKEATDEKIAQFVDITGQDEAVAREVLKANEWNLERSVALAMAAQDRLHAAEPGTGFRSPTRDCGASKIREANSDDSL